MLIQKTALKRSAFIRSRVSATKDRAVRVKRLKKASSIWRSAAWLAVVRRMPCVCCGISHLSQAAHSNQLMFGKGRGLKASDAALMALCGPTPGRVGCHGAHDQGGKLTKTEWTAWEHDMIIMTIVTALDAGLLRYVGESDLHAIIQSDQADTDILAQKLVRLLETGALTLA